jgi:hypothetical protein
MCLAAVVVCALEMLFRSAATFPPIVLIDTRPADVSAAAEAFVRRNPDTIYILTSSFTFRAAEAGDRGALQKLASILVHEEWHLEHGPDEQGAYEAQLTTLLSLGLRDGRPAFDEVRKSMLAVIAAQKHAHRQPGVVVAAAR